MDENCLKGVENVFFPCILITLVTPKPWLRCFETLREKSGTNLNRTAVVWTAVVRFPGAILILDSSWGGTFWTGTNAYNHFILFDMYRAKILYLSRDLPSAHYWCKHSQNKIYWFIFQSWVFCLTDCLTAKADLNTVILPQTQHYPPQTIPHCWCSNQLR